MAHSDCVSFGGGLRGICGCVCVALGATGQGGEGIMLMDTNCTRAYKTEETLNKTQCHGACLRRKVFTQCVSSM